MTFPALDAARSVEPTFDMRPKNRKWFAAHDIPIQKVSMRPCSLTLEANLREKMVGELTR